MLKRYFTLLFLALPTSLFAQDAAQYYPEASDRLTPELLRGALTYRNERTAMAVLAQVCVANRKNAQRAERVLRNSGYFRGYYTLDFDGKSVNWFHDGDLPSVTLSKAGKTIRNCSMLINKNPKRFADLEAQLDEATKEDLQRYPKDTLNYRKGERGWFLRPDLEHAVIIVQFSNNRTGIALRYLED